MNVRGEGAICQSWNSSEMFEEAVQRAQTFLHFAAIHPHSHHFTEYTPTLSFLFSKKYGSNTKKCMVAIEANTIA